MALPFNVVKVSGTEPSASASALTVAEFRALPLTERLRVVLEKRVQFFSDATPIEVDAALRALREAGK